jgi:hypothetical protein
MRTFSSARVLVLTLAALAAACGVGRGPVVQAVADPVSGPASGASSASTAPLARVPLESQATVEGARDLALALLERQAYRELIKRIVLPADLARLWEREGGVDKAAAEFSASGKADELLHMLQQTKQQRPELSEGGDVARFTVVAEEARRTPLTFRKVVDRWYLQN